MRAQGPAVTWQGPVLGTLQGYLMARRQQAWEGGGLQQHSFQGTALCHLAASIAWKKATLLYRRLALCMAAHAVKVRLCSGGVQEEPRELPVMQRQQDNLCLGGRPGSALLSLDDCAGSPIHLGMCCAV